MDDRPIGIFDSGVGGLTVLRAVREALPHESLIYVGDTARTPYGSRSVHVVREFAGQIVRHLVELDCKVVVVACNTASAVALVHITSLVDRPVLGVIVPGARAVVATKAARVAVLGTEATVRSGAYEREIHALAPDIDVTMRACPLLVPLAEEGWLDHPATELVIREYTRDLIESGIEVFVLGCTHYPLFAPLFRRVLGEHARLVDSAEETAQSLVALLQEHRLWAGREGLGSERYFSTDAVDRFARVGRLFLGRDIVQAELTSYQ